MIYTVSVETRLCIRIFHVFGMANKIYNTIQLTIFQRWFQISANILNLLVTNISSNQINPNSTIY